MNIWSVAVVVCVLAAFGAGTNLKSIHDYNDATEDLDKRNFVSRGYEPPTSEIEATYTFKPTALSPTEPGARPETSTTTSAPTTSNYNITTTTPKSEGIKELLIRDCAELAQLNNNTVKSIITTFEAIQNCVQDLTRVLAPNSAEVIFIGKNDSALAQVNLKGQDKLFYNKYSVLPQTVESLYRYIFGGKKLNIQVYSTSDVLLEKLQLFIFDSKYDEAVDISKSLYDQAPNTCGGGIIKHIVEDGGHHVMNFAYQLMLNDAQVIVDSCFPRPLQEILNGTVVQILNRERIAVLKLSPEVDSNGERRLYSDCSAVGADDEQINWKFNPVWNTSLNRVLFEIQNPFYKMDLTVDSSGNQADAVVPVSPNDSRLVLGSPGNDSDLHPWLLLPVRADANQDIRFCIVYQSYTFSLSQTSCEFPKQDVRIKPTDCDKEGWILQPKTSNSPSSPSSSSFSAGTIAIIVSVVVFSLVVISSVLFWFWRKRRNTPYELVQ